mgnify:CR=1 FL=1|jgi:hypothetical protein
MLTASPGTSYRSVEIDTGSPARGAEAPGRTIRRIAPDLKVGAGQ